MNGYRMPTHGDMGIVLQGNAQGTLSVSGTADHTPSFAKEGYYDIWCDVDVWIKIAPTGNDVTTSTGYLVRNNTTISNVMIKSGDRIGAIAGGAGTLRYHKVS